MEQQRFLEVQRRYLERHGVEATSRFIRVPSTRGNAHVLTIGHGPPVVVLNGIGTPAAMWAPLLAQLREVQIHAVDLPGYGLTDITPSFADDLNGNAVRFLDEVFAGLNLRRAAVIGNSLGSHWAIRFMLNHPERVSSAVHVGCPALALDTAAPMPMRLLATRTLGRVLTRLQPPSRAQVVQLSKMVKQHPMEEELIDLLVETERLPHFRHALLSMLRKLIRLRGARPHMALQHEHLARIESPTLIVWGESDPFGNVEVGRRMIESMPRAELHVVRGGHAPWLTDTGKTAELVNGFLRRTARS